GIVVIAYAVQFAYQLNAVGHAAKGLGVLQNGLIGHQTVHSRNGGHVIFQVMDTGNENVVGRQDGAGVVADHPVPDTDAPLQVLFAAEQGNFTSGLRGKSSGDLI